MKKKIKSFKKVVKSLKKGGSNFGLCIKKFFRPYPNYFNPIERMTEKCLFYHSAERIYEYLLYEESRSRGKGGKEVSLDR